MLVEPAIDQRTADEDGLEAIVALKGRDDAVEQSGVRSGKRRGHGISLSCGPSARKPLQGSAP